MKIFLLLPKSQQMIYKDDTFWQLHSLIQHVSNGSYQKSYRMWTDNLIQFSPSIIPAENLLNS